MPRTRPLGEAKRRAEQKQNSDEAFRDVLALYKSRNKKTEEQFAERLGWNRGKIYRVKKDPSNFPLEEIRTAMHTLNVTPEDWLRLGGFN